MRRARTVETPRPAVEKSDRFAPSCSVVICTRNRLEQLDQCLRAVACLDYSNFEVLIVDNAPSDPRTRKVATARGARYVAEPAAGLSRARNRAARECQAEILAYLDDDAFPHPGWLSALVREFRDPAVMAATGKTLPNSLESEAERLWAAFTGKQLGGTERLVVDWQTPQWFELANFGGIGNGGNMAFRRRAFDLWPGFDVRLGLGALISGFEEHHAFFSLIHRGYRIVYTPEACVRHPYPRTLEAVHFRYLEDMSAAAGYMTLLLIEYPLYRREVSRYALEALLGTRRAWRIQATGLRPRIVSRWRTLLALLRGPFLYVRSRLMPAPDR